MGPTTQVTGLRLGPISRMFLVQSDAGVVVVDAGMAGQTDRAVAALAAHGVAPQDVRLILITHGHIDHFGGAKALRARTGAPVAVHTLDADALRNGQNMGPLKPTTPLTGLLLSIGARMVAPDPAIAFEPDIVFDAPWRLDDYGIAGEVLHTPGHTPGSVTLLLDNGAAIVGDLATGNWLFPTRAAPPLVAWDLKRNWESLHALLERHPTRLYITHGQPLAPEALHVLLKRYA